MRPARRHDKPIQDDRGDRVQAETANNSQPHTDLRPWPQARASSSAFGQGATGPGSVYRSVPTQSMVSCGGAGGGAGTKLLASSMLPVPS
jgi:hypothetical protein